MEKKLKLNKSEIKLCKNGQRIAAIRSLRARTGCGLKEGMDLTATIPAESHTNKDGINVPGSRENADGSVTIQFKKRSEQLESIADEIDNALSATESNTTLRGDQVHKFRGYMEQLRIIATELGGSGK